jgi:hypothetical protein
MKVSGTPGWVEGREAGSLARSAAVADNRNIAAANVILRRSIGMATPFVAMRIIGSFKATAEAPRAPRQTPRNSNSILPQIKNQMDTDKTSFFSRIYLCPSGFHPWQYCIFSASVSALSAVAFIFGRKTQDLTHHI